VSDFLEADFEVEAPFTHSTGPALSRFLTALRDDDVIWGRRCETCLRVVVPANDHCDTCGSDLAEWIEVGPAGTIAGFTIVTPPLPLAGIDAPFAFARIVLDGAGTELIHVVRDAETVGRGARVRPVWAVERAGTIRDIDSFEVVS
jgi:uncharacterized OB-fold protein